METAELLRIIHAQSRTLLEEIDSLSENDRAWIKSAFSSLQVVFNSIDDRRAEHDRQTRADAAAAFMADRKK